MGGAGAVKEGIMSKIYAAIKIGGAMQIKKRNDRFELSPHESLLIRVGHFLWNKRRRALKASDLSEIDTLDASLESVWAAKRLYEHRGIYDWGLPGQFDGTIARITAF